jgi:hypothetical protein
MQSVAPIPATVAQATAAQATVAQATAAQVTVAQVTAEWAELAKPAEWAVT